MKSNLKEGLFEMPLHIISPHQSFLECFLESSVLAGSVFHYTGAVGGPFRAALPFLSSFPEGSIGFPWRSHGHCIAG